MSDRPESVSADGALQLLPESRLVQTGPVDHARWNYHGVLGAIQLRRFRLVKSLIGERRYGRLLELGHGSGIFMPELARHCEALSGVDIHDKNSDVAQSLAAVGVRADLRQGSAAAIPFEAGSFDAVVAVSVLEFIEDLDRALGEVERVLAPGGHFLVITPGCSPVLDLGLRLLTGKSAREDFGERRERIIPALERRFAVIERVRYPRGPWLGAPLYTAFKLGRR